MPVSETINSNLRFANRNDLRKHRNDFRRRINDFRRHINDFRRFRLIFLSIYSGLI